MATATGGRVDTGRGSLYAAASEILLGYSDEQIENDMFYLNVDALDAWLANHDINERDELGASLLSYTGHWGKGRAACELLARGADPNSVSQSIEPPLHAFVKSLQFDTVDSLIRHGADVNLADPDDKHAPSGTPLDIVTTRTKCDAEPQYAVATGCMLRFLLRRGATLRETDIYRVGMRKMKRLLNAIRSAGGWKRYVTEPRLQLLLLRLLCLRGRAVAAPPLERLFGLPPPQPGTLRKTRAARRASSLASTTLPKEVFWHILRFWRSKSDGPYPINPWEQPKKSMEELFPDRRLYFPFPEDPNEPFY